MTIAALWKRRALTDIAIQNHSCELCSMKIFVTNSMSAEVQKELINKLKEQLKNSSSWKQPIVLDLDVEFVPMKCPNAVNEAGLFKIVNADTITVK